MSEQPPKKHFPIDGKSRDTFEGNRFEDDHLQSVHSQLMREKEEPTENFSPMPLFLVGMFTLLVFWGGVYINRTGHAFDKFHYDETASGTHEPVGPVVVDMMAKGRKVYVKNCQACHQADGNGLPGVYPPLVGSDWVKDKPERLIKVVLSGLAGEVQVNGVAYTNAMTPFGPILSDLDIAAVLSYVRTTVDFKNESYEVTEATVASVRSEYGARSSTWSQDELNAIHGAVTGDWEPPASEATESEVAEGEPEAAAEVHSH